MKWCFERSVYFSVQQRKAQRNQRWRRVGPSMWEHSYGKVIQLQGTTFDCYLFQNPAIDELVFKWHSRFLSKQRMGISRWLSLPMGWVSKNRSCPLLPLSSLFWVIDWFQVCRNASLQDMAMPATYVVEWGFIFASFHYSCLLTLRRIFNQITKSHCVLSKLLMDGYQKFKPGIRVSLQPLNKEKNK